jgi:hypothetical protein
MHICMYFKATRVFGRWYLFLCRPHSLPALASCWMAFLDPAGDFDWLDRYRHGSAKDRTAPSLSAAPWSKPGSMRVLKCLFSLTSPSSYRIQISVGIPETQPPRHVIQHEWALGSAV